MHISHRGRFPNDLTNQVTRDGRDPVASGGFADIYRGMLRLDNGQSIKVAIKAIKTYSGEDSKFSKKQKRLRREIKVWLDLRHDNVLPLLGTTMGFGQFPAMVCPWVENGALTSYLNDRHDSLSVIEILGLLNDVASGLQHLHSRFVVHGDLSGSNVLIHESGRACIADFGLSMLLTELGASTFATSFHARGTLRWTAPELLDLEVPEDDVDDDSPRVSATTQSDVYSFGSIMFQILSGKVPYHYYKREAQVLHAISKGKTPKRPSSALVTERRWMFIQRCWSAVDTLRPLSEKIVEFTGKELVGHRPREIVAPSPQVEDVDARPRARVLVESTAIRPHLRLHSLRQLRQRPGSMDSDSSVPEINVEPPSGPESTGSESPELVSPALLSPEAANQPLPQDDHVGRNLGPLTTESKTTRIRPFVTPGFDRSLPQLDSTRIPWVPSIPWRRGIIPLPSVRPTSTSNAKSSLKVGPRTVQVMCGRARRICRRRWDLRCQWVGRRRLWHTQHRLG
ncbi:kinase-like domain-containing protein [Boletus edulis]|nr:kinase-like domain-containing protein [Boletus edulis]